MILILGGFIVAGVIYLVIKGYVWSGDAARDASRHGKAYGERHPAQADAALNQINRGAAMLQTWSDKVGQAVAKRWPDTDTETWVCPNGHTQQVLSTTVDPSTYGAKRSAHYKLVRCPTCGAWDWLAR